MHDMKMIKMIDDIWLTLDADKILHVRDFYMNFSSSTRRCTSHSICSSHNDPLWVSLVDSSKLEKIN